MYNIYYSNLVRFFLQEIRSDSKIALDIFITLGIFQ